MRALRADVALATTFGLAVVASYAAWLYGYLFPADGYIGHDFGGFLPAMIDGVWWFRTNGLTTPWFTPAFCGGIPAFPEPQSMFWSLPQGLSFVMDPLQASFVSSVIFAGLGYLGVVILARDVFTRSHPAAAFAATIFTWQDFFHRRVVTGSLGYQPWMLVPLTAWVLLTPTEWRVGRWRGGNAIVAGIAIAAWLHGGLTTLMIPAALAVLALALTTADPRAALTRLVTRGLPAALLAAGLCASKLSAARAFMRHFQRDAYPLPGFADPLTAASFALRSLFWPSEALAAEAEALLQNRMWAVEAQEWAYGLTAVPWMALVIGAGLHLVAVQRGLRAPLPRVRRVALAALIPLAALPVALTTYTPAWNSFLKSLPVVGQTSFPFRWVIVFVPVVCVAAGALLDAALLPRRWRAPLLVVGALLVVAQHRLEPEAWYRIDGAFYNPGPVRRAWSAPTPVVTEQVDYATALAAQTEFYSPNDFATRGWSAIDCYAPIFGYRQEDLPVGSLRPGPALAEADGVLNVKNPACYVFPEENGCAPGDHFPVARRADAEAFLARRPFPFTRSTAQHAADTLTAASLVAACVGGIAVAWTRIAAMRAASRP